MLSNYHVPLQYNIYEIRQTIPVYFAIHPSAPSTLHLHLFIHIIVFLISSAGCQPAQGVAGRRPGQAMRSSSQTPLNLYRCNDVNYARLLVWLKYILILILNPTLIPRRNESGVGTFSTFQAERWSTVNRYFISTPIENVLSYQKNEFDLAELLTEKCRLTSNIEAIRCNGGQPDQ